MPLTDRFPVVRDLFERVASTFVAAVLAAWVADGLNWTSALQIDTWRTYALAGVAAVVSLLKGLVATRIGRNPSASLDPAVKLQPVRVPPAKAVDEPLR